jgi:hypothetical protein
MACICFNYEPVTKLLKVLVGTVRTHTLTKGRIRDSTNVDNASIVPQPDFSAEVIHLYYPVPALLSHFVCLNQN